MASPLRLVFWETTKACNLSCKHCRAVPQRTLGPGELNTRQAFDLIDEIGKVSKPVKSFPLKRGTSFPCGGMENFTCADAAKLSMRPSVAIPNTRSICGPI